MCTSPLSASTNTAPGWLPTASSRAWLLAAIGIALMLHVITVARSPLIAPDGIGFIQFARELKGDARTAIREHAQHPGYPLLILATHAITDHVVPGDAGWEFAARLASGLAGLVCVPLLWFFVRGSLDEQAANVAAVLFALLPTVRQNAGDALSDSSHLALYLCAAWLVCRAASDGAWWRFVLAGAAGGLAFCVRPEGLAVAVAPALCVAAVPAWRAALGSRRAVTGAAGLLAGAALLAAPLIAGSGKLTGKLAGKPGWQQLQREAVAASGKTTPEPDQTHPAPGVRTAHVIPVAAASTAWSDPLPSALAAGSAQLCTALAEVLHGLLLIPLFAGIPLVARRMPRTSFSVCLLLALAQIGLLLLLYRWGGYMNRRHLLPLIVVLMPSISLGTLATGRWLAGLARRPSAGRWLLLCVFAAVLAVVVPRAVRPLHQSRLHTLEAAAWLRARCRSTDLVGSNAAEVVYRASLDGGPRTGSVLRPGWPIDADGPLQRNTYLVVELDSGNAEPAWITEISAEFSPVARVAGDAGLRQRDLLIYRRVEDRNSAAVFEASSARR